MNWKKMLLVGMAVTGASLSSPALAAKGAVVAICRSHILVSAPQGYAILDVYGYGPSRGDTIAGDFEAYGMKKLFNISEDRDFQAYVDEYWLTRERAIEKFSEKCA